MMMMNFFFRDCRIDMSFLIVVLTLVIPNDYI